MKKLYDKKGLALAFINGSVSIVDHPQLTPYIDTIKKDPFIERVIAIDPLIK